MKKTILLSILTYTFTLIGQTNTYHPFPSNNAIWNFNANAVCLSSGSTVENFSIVMSGDTTINNVLYKKLQTPFVDRNMSGTCTVKNKGYQGAIREEASNKIVYLIKPQETTETLLFDFNLQIGDSIKGALDGGMGDTVISIDSVLVGNNFRKRWNINTCYNISIIEGIGSNYGLIEPTPGCMSDIADFSITCFKEGTQVAYPNSVNNCQTITSLTTNNVNNEPISIFPNPANGEIQLDFKGRKIKEVLLFNILGEQIITKEVTNTNLLKIDNLPAGTVMVVTVDEDNQRTYHKIMVSER
tara:strand:+ start:4654 stop:5553 length:900 start_codon:yes stop_codon:yes gene_type:complete